MSCIWKNCAGLQVAATRVVEIMDPRRVLQERFRCRNVIDADRGPDAVGVTKRRQPRFARDAGAGEDDDISARRSARSTLRLPPTFSDGHLRILSDEMTMS